LPAIYLLKLKLNTSVDGFGEIVITPKVSSSIPVDPPPALRRTIGVVVSQYQLLSDPSSKNEVDAGDVRLVPTFNSFGPP
jgi:ABC-type ATPase involved in cell division